MSAKDRVVAWWRRLRGGGAPAPAGAPPAPTVRVGWFEAMLDETRFLARFPDHAGVLARMDPVATDSVPIMAVGLRRRDDPEGRLVLMVNLGYFRAHPEHRVGVLLHEIQHVRLGHLSRPALHRVAQPRIMEIAMELSADEGVRDPLPGNGLSLEEFARHGLRPGQDTMTRYALLRDAHARGEFDLRDHWFARMRDLHRPAREGGACAGLGDLVDERSDGATEGSWSREGYAMGYRTAPREIERMRARIAAHLRGERGGADEARRDPRAKRAAKALERAVLFSAGGSSLHWPRVLRAAFPPVRAVVPDYLRPNRRFRERVGEVPGRRRRPPPPRLLVAVDTSGSMSGDALDRCARELPRLARCARVVVAEADAAVHRVGPAHAQPGAFLGGGDTDFAPVFDEARARGHLDGVVYFTDGRGAMPEVPPGLPVLWVLTHDGPFEPDWGSVVRLP